MSALVKTARANAQACSCPVCHPEPLAELRHSFPQLLGLWSVDGLHLRVALQELPTTKESPSSKFTPSSGQPRPRDWTVRPALPQAGALVQAPAPLPADRALGSCPAVPPPV